MRLLPIAIAGALLAVSPSAVAQPAPPSSYQAPRHRGPMRPANEAPRRSKSMMVAGIVLTSLASGTLIAGAITTAAFASGGGYSFLGAWVVGVPIIGGSTIFAGIGIPLWVVGASTPATRRADAIPSVSLGLGSATLRWSF